MATWMAIGAIALLLLTVLGTIVVGGEPFEPQREEDLREASDVLEKTGEDLLEDIDRETLDADKEDLFLKSAATPKHRKRRESDGSRS